MSTRKRILYSAIEILRKNGYHSTSMNMISEACSISKGNLTYHYPTKEELFKDCIGTSASYFKKNVFYPSFEKNNNELEGLIHFFKNVRSWLYSDNKVIGCIFSNTALELRHTNPELADIPVYCLREFKALIKEKIESGQENGTIAKRENSDDLIEDIFLGYEGAMIYSRIENSLTYFDLFIEKTFKYLKVYK
ncbi:MAG: TetR/AcrR family transcriptional regulator [Candidatus Sericytochromatia bacterium]